MAKKFGVEPESDTVSRAFMAALLMAARKNCNCETCKILRRVADEVAKEFVSED